MQLKSEEKNLWKQPHQSGIKPVLINPFMLKVFFQRFFTWIKEMNFKPEFTKLSYTLKRNNKCLFTIIILLFNKI